MKGSFENAVEEVTEAMRNHVRHFVTPLSMDRPMSNKVTLEGTGSYVTIGDGRAALTCEHVAKRGNLNIGFMAPRTFSAIAGSGLWTHRRWISRWRR